MEINDNDNNIIDLIYQKVLKKYNENMKKIDNRTIQLTKEDNDILIDKCTINGIFDELEYKYLKLELTDGKLRKEEELTEIENNILEWNYLNKDKDLNKFIVFIKKELCEIKCDICDKEIKYNYYDNLYLYNGCENKNISKAMCTDCYFRGRSFNENPTQIDIKRLDDCYLKNIKFYDLSTPINTENLIEYYQIIDEYGKLKKYEIDNFMYEGYLFSVNNFKIFMWINESYTPFFFDKYGINLMIEKGFKLHNQLIKKFTEIFKKIAIRRKLPIIQELLYDNDITDYKNQMYNYIKFNIKIDPELFVKFLPIYNIIFRLVTNYINDLTFCDVCCSSSKCLYKGKLFDTQAPNIASTFEIYSLVGGYGSKYDNHNYYYNNEIKKLWISGKSMVCDDCVTYFVNNNDISL